MDNVTGLIRPVLTSCCEVLASLTLKTKLVTSVIFVFAVYYKTKVSKVPKLVCKEGKFKNFLIKNVPEMQEKFSPLWLFFGSVPQTVIAAVIRSKPEILWDEVEDVDLPDQGQVHLNWLHMPKASTVEREHKPIVLFLPGLTGNSNSNYICQFSQLIGDCDYRQVVFTYRGMGGKGLKTAKTYCACYTDDLQLVVQHITRRFPDAPIMAIGVSLGAMILSHYLSVAGDSSGLVAAMTVSVPWCPFASMKTLSTPINRMLFNRRLAKALISMVEEHSHLFEKLVNLDHVRKSDTIHEFDESFTAKVFGFDSLDHYYSSAGLADKFQRIRIPLLALNSADDPFAPGHSIPVDRIGKSENVALLLTERGGHVAFVDTYFAPTYLERVFRQYVTSVFDTPMPSTSM
ncbi:phospholipase ABHD3-like [Watersipora subatra]|uniref:phospholipase ABHD3-like n=1 Tax=Watersipora subatra TaxID=2589382 RepID=UPI00355BD473